jgi:citrate lyase subunit beta / citryl-CoA lyase
MALHLPRGGEGMKATAGHRGEDVRNDCWVSVEPGAGKIRIESSVQAIYGSRIESVLRQCAGSCGLDSFDIEVVDSGAFDWCLWARIEAAAAKVGKRPGRLDSPPGAKSRKAGASFRTRLYLPGNTPKFFANAGFYGADVLIFDLEDAVPPSEKEEARILVRHALEQVDFGAAQRWVRVNRGEHEAADLAMVRHSQADAVLVPKAETAEEIESLLVGKAIVPLLETARGIANAHAIAGVPGVRALAFGLEDYRADVRAQRGSLEATGFALAQVVNAARSHGLPPLASVWGDLDDVEGFAAECRRMRGMGFEGIGCLHPSQVPVAARAWQPEPAAIDSARQIIAAYEEAGGAVRVNDRMVDGPVAEQARRVLADAETALPRWRIV